MDRGILELRWGLGKTEKRVHVTEQIWRSKFGVWGGKDILMHR